MKLHVYLNQKKVGELFEGSFTFQYDPNWLNQPASFPISNSLPLDDTPFLVEQTRPFFSGLLPEGLVRQQICRRLGISVQNDFGLLVAIGKECAGALSFWAEEETIDFTGDYLPLPKNQFRINLPSQPLLYNPEGLRLSLAGVQEKTALYFENEQWFEPRGMAPSSHILKPAIEGLSFTVENEAFCMQLAEKVGLPVPKAQILKWHSNVYAVERYDRKKTLQGIERLHQEDFCQALGIHPDAKYETEGGIGLQKCFQLLDLNSLDPLHDRRALLHWVIFNVCIGNADAHSKNLSLLIDSKGFRLAPFYDLLSTAVYPELNQKIAMKIGGENRLDWLSERHWQRFAEENKINAKFVLKAAHDFSGLLLKEAKELSKSFVEEYGAEKIIRAVIARIEKQAKAF